MEHDASSQPEGRVIKTLAIRLEGEQHAQLTMIAQLEELTITDAIRDAINRWIESKRNNPQLQVRAEAVLEAIEQEAATRRGAIAALLSEPTLKTTKGGNGRSGRRPTAPSAQRGGDLIPGYL